MNGTLKNVPTPMISRTRPMTVIAAVKPKPMPMPSKNDGIMPFFEAYASARPKMMQLTTISGM